VIAEEKLETPIIRNLAEQPVDRSTCGFRQRLITAEDHVNASVSYLKIFEMKPHFHIKTTELYYIIKGAGVLKLDGKAHSVSAGMVVAIPPGVVHELVGEVEVLVIGTPPFQPDDQFFKDPKSMY
jgi:mannose-6-phosphate isomerase-like protein (cupin superfamily)